MNEAGRPVQKVAPCFQNGHLTHTVPPNSPPHIPDSTGMMHYKPTDPHHQRHEDQILAYLADTPVKHKRAAIPHKVRMELSLLLDPPGRDDWRMLAGCLGVDKYIPYFKSLPSYGMSPTVALLTFYELTGQGVGELEGGKWEGELKKRGPGGGGEDSKWEGERKMRGLDALVKNP